MTQQIRSVVIPAAGQGTRLLPATKTTPKELLNVYDRPALQFAIDEAVALGAERVVIVIHPDKDAIRAYLAPNPAYVATLRASGKAELGLALSEVDVPAHLTIRFAEQARPMGLGDAILCARDHVLPGPVGVILPDDLILGTACLPEMAAHYGQGHMIAAMEVRADQTHHYGIFRTSGLSVGRIVPVSGMIEKPAAGQAPSRLAAVGRYILDPSIFATLGSVTRGIGGEVQLTDAIARDAATVPLCAYRFSGTRYDCGTHDGLLDAAIARQAQVRAQVRARIRAQGQTASPPALAQRSTRPYASVQLARACPAIP